MKKRLNIIGLGILVSCSQPTNEEAIITLEDITDPTFKIGQVWQYHTRASEPNSTFTILKIEKSNLDTIVHIHINGIRFKTDTLNINYQDISHSPFSRAAITASVTKLVDVTNELPEFEEGYLLWREAYLKDNGGIFSVPVNQSLDYTEETFATGTKTVQTP
jgi:hypothetical protein